MKPPKLPILLFGLLILSIPLRSQEATDNPATVIMQKVIERMKINEELKHKHLNFKKHYVETKVDDLIKPKKIKIETDQVIEVRPPKGDEFLILEDGEVKNKKQTGNGQFEKIMNALSILFNYEMAEPTEDCPTCPLMSKGGKAYMVINFRAKGNVKTNGDDVKEIMNRSAGKIYIDIEGLYVQRFESNLTNSYERGWGIFQLKQADSILEQNEINTPEGKIIVVTSSSIRYRYFLFGEKAGIRSWTYGDYNYVP